MSKTIYFYRMNIFDDSSNQEKKLDKSEAADLVEQYIESLRNSRKDRVAISKFASRENDRDIYFEIIDDPTFGAGKVNDSQYIFGLIGQRAGLNYHLREDDTASSKDLPLQSNQSLEAATFFLLDKKTMVCCFAREKNGPMIEELNGLFAGYKDLGINRINMSPVTNPSSIEEIIGKKVIASVGYEIEVPTDQFFELLDVDFPQSEALVERGYTVLKVELRSNSNKESLLEGMGLGDKKNVITKIVEAGKKKLTSKKLKNPKLYSSAKNDGGIKREYSFLNDKINYIAKVDFSSTRLQSFAEKHPQFEGRMSFFMFTKLKLQQKLIKAIRNKDIPSDR